jgi:uncharacterized membrane protein
MSVELAFTLVISGGLVAPPDRRPEDQQQVPVVASRRIETVEDSPTVAPASSRPAGRVA